MYEDVLGWAAALESDLSASLRGKDTKESLLTELLGALEVDHLSR